jgi:hypothetical protein
MSGGRLWSSGDRTGGPLDRVFDSLRHDFPALVVERLVGSLPADDDNVFWLSIAPGASPPLLGPETIQVDTNVQGRPPFVIEGDRQLGEYVTTSDPDDALLRIADWLRRRLPSELSTSD